MLLYSLIIAFAMYSAIPMPRVEWSEKNMRFSLCFFPLVGAAAGAVCIFWNRFSDFSGVESIAKIRILSVIPLMITGGIHADGFVDTMDAVHSWQDQKKKLEILKDSHTGAFAVMGCAGMLLLSAALYAEADPAKAPLLICVFVLSRALSAWTLVTLKGARPQGMLGDFSQAAQKRAVTVSGSIYTVLCLAVWAILGGWIAAMCAAAAVLCVLAYRRMAYRQFGGVTGDLAGWFLQVTELALTAVIVIGGKLI